MTVSTRSDAPRFDVEGYSFFPLAVPSRGSKELAVWSIEVAPGAASPPHQHDREVIFVVATGRMIATIDGVEGEAGPGDAVIVPAHVDFTLNNASTEQPASMTVAATIGMQAIMNGNAIQPPHTL